MQYQGVSCVWPSSTSSSISSNSSSSSSVASAESPRITSPSMSQTPLPTFLLTETHSLTESPIMDPALPIHPPSAHLSSTLEGKLSEEKLSHLLPQFPAEPAPSVDPSVLAALSTSDPNPSLPSNLQDFDINGIHSSPTQCSPFVDHHSSISYQDQAFLLDPSVFPSLLTPTLSSSSLSSSCSSSNSSPSPSPTYSSPSYLSFLSGSMHIPSSTPSPDQPPPPVSLSMSSTYPPTLVPNTMDPESMLYPMGMGHDSSIWTMPMTECTSLSGSLESTLGLSPHTAMDALTTSPSEFTQSLSHPPPPSQSIRLSRSQPTVGIIPTLPRSTQNASRTGPIRVKSRLHLPVVPDAPNSPQGRKRKSSLSSSSSSSITTNSSPSSSPSSCSAPLEHAPRPPNAFILFRRHWQPSVTANNPHVDTRQISRILGKMWNDADHSEKERFRKLSKEVKVEHEKLYPGYKYSRRKRSPPLATSSPTS